MIREVRATEMDAMMDLYRDLHGGDDPLADRARLESLWLQILNDPKILYFVFEYERTIVSGCHLVIIPNLTRGGRPYGVIENVVTKKEYRNRGFAHRVLKHALDFAWSKDCYKVMLMTGRKDAKVFRLYEGVGFDSEAKKGFVAKPV